MADDLVVCICGDVSIKVLVVERFDVEVLRCWLMRGGEGDLEGEEEEEEGEEGCPGAEEADNLVYFLRKPMVGRVGETMRLLLLVVLLFRVAPML